MTAAQIAAMPIFGRNTFYTAIATPSVIQSGDPQFVRYQDQSGASLLSLGGGPRRGNAYLIEGVSITDFVNRASWVPSTEAVEDMQGPAQDLRRRNGARRRRRVQRHRQVGLERVARQRAVHEQARLGHRPAVLRQARRASPNPPQYYYSWAGSVGGPIKSGQDVLLVQQGRLHAASTRNNVLTFPTALERDGRLLAVRNARPVIASTTR